MLYLAPLWMLLAATETDQVTTPSRPLPDVGAALSRKVVSIIEADRSGDPPQRVLSRWVGRNFLRSRMTAWVTGLRSEEGRAVTFRPRVFGSIYPVAISPVPMSFAFDAPTIRANGVYFGTDKIDHFFQQGYRYFRITERNGGDPAMAVAWGVRGEHSYFGTLASGVFSNADLAANYAGMKFYQNLTAEVRVGDRVLPALFERTADGAWKLRAGIDAARILEPFITSHFDESLNPSRYRLSRGVIRAHIRNRCDSWSAFYGAQNGGKGISPVAAREMTRTWFGENYGQWLPARDEVSVATVCSAVDPRSSGF